jgi:RNA recognition motif-containing protein
MNIYVGNLPYSVNDQSLRSLFEQFGVVSSVKIIIDQISGKSKGFAFVDMGDESEALAAIEALNGKEFEGRTIVVNKAKPRAQLENKTHFKRRSRF